MRYKTKRLLKQWRHTGRRWRAAQKWGAQNLAQMPAVLGNAMPKSGSHLIIQILEGLTDLGPFVNPGFPPLNRFEDNRRLPPDKILAEIHGMKPGDIRYGYLHAEEPWLSAVTGPGRATIFVHRDPRDWVISQTFYATDMHTGHMLHNYYNQLGSIQARIEAAINGVETPALQAPSLVTRYSHYLGWRNTPGVLCLRFEDLIFAREQTIDHILTYLAGFGFEPAVERHRAVATLAGAVAPRKSGTFRKGQPGEWREHFSPQNIALFKQEAGDLLVQLGYEENHGW